VQDRWCGLLAALPLHRDARQRHAAFARPGMPDDPDAQDRVLYVPEDVKASHEQAWEAMFESLVAAP